ncbi:MAG: hypothetical protein DVB26_00075 [Verrucomicrobia bacterium]|nr:MAG: hypothetical protein DVB26_00075 [Verrucomicrobiota bacterium]
MKVKAIFYILAILTIGGAAYFSYDHSLKFKVQQDKRLADVKKNKETTHEAEITEKDLKDEQAALTKVLNAREETKQSIAALKATESKAKDDLAKLDAEIAKQKEELKDLAKNLAEIQVVLTGLGDGVAIDGIEDFIDKIAKEVTDLKTKVEENETLVAGAEKRLADNKAEESRLVGKTLTRNVRIGNNGMEAVITGVNQGWGFVVIGAGNSAGFTPQTSLLVKRDGRLIGRVHPTAIEPSQTIADIDPESLASGVRLQPGDRVILANPVSH